MGLGQGNYATVKTFVVASDAPTSGLKYICAAHSSMTGEIHISDKLEIDFANHVMDGFYVNMDTVGQEVKFKINNNHFNVELITVGTDNIEAQYTIKDKNNENWRFKRQDDFAEATHTYKDGQTAIYMAIK